MHHRKDLSQAELAEEVPLVTDEATVTTVENLDENRSEAVRNAVPRLLRDHGRGDWVNEVTERVNEDDVEAVDWDRLAGLLDEHDADDALADSVSDLRGRYERAYPSLLRVRVDPDTDVDFVPGQYCAVTYNRTPRAYSLANSPNGDELEFCIRRVPGGRLTSDLANNADVGDRVTVRGPAGDFTVEEPSDRDAVFVATGTGVAPLRSMIRYTFEEGRDEHDGERRDVWLVLGCAWKDDLPYRGEFRRLGEERENFHFVPTLSRERELGGWTGETAYVQHTLVKYVRGDALDEAALPPDAREYVGAEPATDVDARIDFENVEAYACGIGAMVDPLVETLSALGVADAHLNYESYG